MFRFLSSNAAVLMSVKEYSQNKPKRSVKIFRKHVENARADKSDFPYLLAYFWKIFGIILKNLPRPLFARSISLTKERG